MPKQITYASPPPPLTFLKSLPCSVQMFSSFQVCFDFSEGDSRGRQGGIPGY